VWLRILPSEDVDAALHAIFIDPAQGSLRGAKALYERALQRYVGVTLRAVHEFLRKQETLQATQPKAGYLVVQPTNVSDVGHWEADLTDVHLFTKSAAKHLFVCVDMFSKHAWAAPIASKHAANVAAALESIFLAEGPPETLRTDGGSDMNNADVAALCVRYSVARKVCAPYNSQCNGGVERLNRTLKDAMAKQAHEWTSAQGTVDWVALLPQVLFGYNTSVHRTTGQTPFFVQRGRVPRPLGALALAAREGAKAAGPAFRNVHAIGQGDGGDDSCGCGSASGDGREPEGQGNESGSDDDRIRLPAARATAAAGRPALARAPAPAPAASLGTGAASSSAKDSAVGLSAAAHPSHVGSGRASAGSGSGAGAGGQEPEYHMSRIVATRIDCENVTRYWVRWEGYGASADSWVTAPMAGVSDKQLQLWIKRTHRGFMPSTLPEPFASPPGRAGLDVPVTAADRAALRRFEQAQDALAA
jgi:hypothetical protein